MGIEPKYHSLIFLAPDTGADGGDDFAGDGFSQRPFDDSLGPQDDHKDEDPFDWEDSPAATGLAAEAEDNDTEPVADDSDSSDDTVPAGSDVDTSMMQLADEYGIDRSRAEALHKAGLLKDMLRSRMNEEAAGAVTTQSQEQPGDTEPVTPKIEYDKSQFDEETVKVLEQFEQALNYSSQQLKGVLAQNAELQTGMQAQRLQQFEADLDRQFSTLADDQKKLVGEGPTAKLSRSSPEYQRRAAVERAFLAYSVGLKELGQSANTDEVFQMAASSVLSKDANTLARRELNTAVQNRAKQHLQKPTTRRTLGKEANPEQRAIAVARDILREKGVLSEDYV